MSAPEGYRWITRNGARILIEDDNYEIIQDRITKNYKTRYDGFKQEFASYDAAQLYADHFKKEQEIERALKKQRQVRSEHELQDKLRQSKQTTPRRKAMKEKYDIGDKITLNDKTYTVHATEYNRGKLNNYWVTDENGGSYYINRFGEIRKR